MAARSEIPHWGEEETRSRLGMYNERTRCLDRVVFHDANSAIGYFVLKPERFPPFVWRLIGIPIAEEVYVTDAVVEGHFTPDYGISIVRGVDQLAAAVALQSSLIHRQTGKESRLARIEGPIKFSQPVVAGDTMLIRPSNLSDLALTGDCEIIVDGSTAATFKGIQFELVYSRGNYLDYEVKEYIKPILIEAGAQTAVADFRYRRNVQTPEEQTKGDFLMYAGIRGPIEFYEDILPGGMAEIHMVRDSENSQVADITIWVNNRKVAEIRGNECAVGNRERTRLFIERVVQRRRSRMPRGSE